MTNDTSEQDSEYPLLGSYPPEYMVYLPLMKVILGEGDEDRLSTEPMEPGCSGAKDVAKEKVRSTELAWGLGSTPKFGLALPRTEPWGTMQASQAKDSVYIDKTGKK